MYVCWFLIFKNVQIFYYYLQKTLFFIEKVSKINIVVCVVYVSLFYRKHFTMLKMIVFVIFRSL